MVAYRCLDQDRSYAARIDVFREILLPVWHLILVDVVPLPFIGGGIDEGYMGIWQVLPLSLLDVPFHRDVVCAIFLFLEDNCWRVRRV